MKSKTVKTRLLPAFMLVVALMVAFPVKAQVTIGKNEEPVEGALLQLKDKTEVETGADNVNATKGLAFPRVNLSHRKMLYPMFGDASTPDGNYETNKAIIDPKHTGLVVYNMYESASDVDNPDLTFKKGFHYWDGMQWQEMGGSGGSGGGGEDTPECEGPVTVDFDSGTEEVTIPGAVGLLGSAVGVYEVAVVGKVAAINPDLNVDALGIGLLNLSLDDIAECDPFIASSDGWLTGMDVTFDVTGSQVAANLNLLVGEDFSIDAYLYEAVGNSGEFSLVAGTEMPLASVEVPPLAVLSPLLPNGSVHGTPLTFAEGAIKITEGNKYILVVTLSSGGTLSLLAYVEGNITGTMNIECTGDTGGGSIETPIGEVSTEMLFTQSVDERILVEHEGSYLNETEVIIDWDSDDILFNTGLVDFDDANDTFTMTDSAVVELSGYIVYLSTGYGFGQSSELPVDLSIQVKKKGVNSGGPDDDGWINYSTLAMQPADAHAKNTLTVPNAVYSGGEGDMIRMRIVINPDNIADNNEYGFNPTLAVPNSGGFSKSIKIVKL